MTSAAAGLSVQDLTVDFGGLRALDRVSLDAPLGRITGLIGPNGAGKTTTFAACTGLLRPTSGSVALFGADAGGMSPQRRARAGLGRTFQRVQLCESLSVRDNVLVGCEAGQAGSNPIRQLFATRREQAVALEQVDVALTTCGITGLAGQPVGSLSTGDRRLVELARALAGRYRLLLLDEPSSGLDVTATEQFGQILRRVVAEQGTGLLLVEHDMSLVMEVCEHIYVLDFGSMIFDGSPRAVRSSDRVRAAYLGSAA